MVSLDMAERGIYHELLPADGGFLGQRVVSSGSAGSGGRMARYLVEVEGERESAQAAANDGLAVAKALARKRSLKSTHAVVVRDSETGKVVARFDQGIADTPQPTLVSSVKRMRAANDRLKEGLVPSTSRRKKRA
jgi:hypothetical protein